MSQIGIHVTPSGKKQTPTSGVGSSATFTFLILISARFSKMRSITLLIISAAVILLSMKTTTAELLSVFMRESISTTNTMVEHPCDYDCCWGRMHNISCRTYCRAKCHGWCRGPCASKVYESSLPDE